MPRYVVKAGKKVPKLKALDEWVGNIIEKNKHLNFVQRIKNPKDSVDLGGGTTATHMMSWTNVGPERKPIVYPEVIQRPGRKMLEVLPRKGASDYAISSGENISFKTDREADMFSKHYKRYWKKDYGGRK